ncbi:MAG: RNA polymerase sigma factor [Tepidiformaceae bacterium]
MTVNCCTAGTKLEPFEQIVVGHGATVLRVCRGLLGPHDAEDAWSETFLAALRAYPRLRPGSNVRAWLITIARNKAFDVHRGRARQAVSIDDVPEPAAGRPPDRDDDLWSALAALPDKQRGAITLHHIAGLSYLEVAGVLGNSEAAARRAAADGMKTLRARYKGASQ